MTQKILKFIFVVLLIPFSIQIGGLFFEYNYFQTTHNIQKSEFETRSTHSNFATKGYFNNDKIIDNLYLSIIDKELKKYISRLDFDKIRLIEDLPLKEPNTPLKYISEIYSNNNNIPALKFTESVPETVINEGDLDGDGSEEISIVFFKTNSLSLGYQTLYSLKNNEWQLIGSSTINYLDIESPYEKNIFYDKKCNCILLSNYTKWSEYQTSSIFDTIYLR